MDKLTHQQMPAKTSVDRSRMGLPAATIVVRWVAGQPLERTTTR